MRWTFPIAERSKFAAPPPERGAAVAVPKIAGPHPSPAGGHCAREEQGNER